MHQDFVTHIDAADRALNLSTTTRGMHQTATDISEQLVQFLMPMLPSIK